MIEQDSKLPSQIRFSAMNLMARREHSCNELKVKLLSRYPEHSDIIAEAIKKLESDGLLSDSRFSELFIESSARKGKGPNQIKQSLRQKGVNDVVVATAFQGVDVDWYELAKQVMQKKFSTLVEPLDFKMRVKQQKFLEYRGFTHEQIAGCYNI